MTWYEHLYGDAKHVNVLGGARGSSPSKTSAWELVMGRRPTDLKNYTVSSKSVLVRLTATGWIYVKAGRNVTIKITDQENGASRRITAADHDVRLDYLGVTVALDANVPGYSSILSATFTTPVQQLPPALSGTGDTQDAWDIPTLLRLVGSARTEKGRASAQLALFTLLAVTSSRHPDVLPEGKNRTEGLVALGEQVIGRHTKYQQERYIGYKPGEGRGALEKFIATHLADVSSADSTRAHVFITDRVKTDPSSWAVVRDELLAEGEAASVFH